MSDSRLSEISSYNLTAEAKTHSSEYHDQGGFGMVFKLEHKQTPNVPESTKCLKIVKLPDELFVNWVRARNPDESHRSGSICTKLLSFLQRELAIMELLYGNSKSSHQRIQKTVIEPLNMYRVFFTEADSVFC